MRKAPLFNIAEFLCSKHKQATLQGRVLDIRKRPRGGVLVIGDATGFVEATTGSRVKLKKGDLVELRVIEIGGCLQVSQWQVIARPRFSLTPQANWEKLMAGRIDWDRFLRRHDLIQAFRTAFDARSYLEIETPALHTAPTLDPNIRSIPVEFQNKGRCRRYYLQTSPEYYMKMLMVAGAQKIFQFAHVFRDDEAGDLHNPEFTILEWYCAGMDYKALSAELEELVAEAVALWKGSAEIRYRGRKIDLRPPWNRMPLTHAFKKFAGVDLLRDNTYAKLRKRLSRAEFPPAPRDTWEALFFRVLVSRIEPHLGIGKPTVLHDYPARLGTMARRKPEDPDWLERFEVYMAGIEIANGYSELTDWKEQQRRFHESLRRFRRPETDLPENYIRALTFGMPPAAGVALGLDRLLMILGDYSTLDDVFFFPFRQDGRQGGRKNPQS